jgi:hypothetical protein
VIRSRMNSVLPPVPVASRTIRICGGDYGIAAEVADDEQRHLWQLLGLLDGSRTRTEISDGMRARDPGLPAADVEDAQRFADAGYLGDGAQLAGDRFSPAEAESYRRNFGFFPFFHRPPLTQSHLQAGLRDARVTVLGLGGLGSHGTPAPAVAGVVPMVDDDLVEPHNPNRQVLYTDVPTSTYVWAVLMWAEHARAPGARI